MRAPSPQIKSTTVRVFTCQDCGHHMRFARDHCGFCFSEKEWYQKPGTWAMIVLIVLATILALGIPLLALV